MPGWGLSGFPGHINFSQYIQQRAWRLNAVALDEVDTTISGFLENSIVFHEFCNCFESHDTADLRDGFNNGTAHRTNSPDAVREAALAGMGIAVTPLWLIDGCVEQGRLKVILEDYTPTPMEVHATYPDRRFVPRKVRHFIDHIHATFNSQ